MHKLAIFAITLSSVSCQTRKPATPQITDAQLKRLYKAALAAQPYEQELAAARKAIVDACNVPGWTVKDGENGGDPVCVEKPKPGQKKK